MENTRINGIPIITADVVNAAIERHAYSLDDLKWIADRLAATEPNLLSHIGRTAFDVLGYDFDFALFHILTGGIGTRRERRVAQNIVLHTLALISEQAGYYKTGKFGIIALDEFLPVYSMRDDIFVTLRREKEREQNYKTARILEMETLTRTRNPLLQEEIEQVSGYGTRWERWSEGFEPGIRPFQAGYVTTYEVLAAISMQHQKTMRSF